MENIMQQLCGFAVLFGLGWIGYRLFRRCHIPNPSMLGSLFATGCINVLGYFPPITLAPLSYATNVLIGTVIARKIDRNVCRTVRALAYPISLQLAGILTLSFVCGWVFYALNGDTVSLTTALISGTAGGIAEMVLFGMSMNADLAVIAFMQFVRVMVANLLIPFVAQQSLKRGHAGWMDKSAKDGHLDIPRYQLRHYLILAVCGMTGAALGLYFKLPAGGILGALVCCGTLSLILNRRYTFNEKLRTFAMIAMGIVLGRRMTPQMLAMLGDLLLPTAVTTVIMTTGCALLALLLRHNTGWDYVTCLVCSSPGGLSQVTIFADEIGMDAFIVSTFHTMRLMSIVIIYPWIVMPIVGA